MSQDPNARPPALPGAPAIAGYEILDVLGEGGMGLVYKARQIKLGRLVAVKSLNFGALKGPGVTEKHREVYRQRFYQEASALARMSHENIVQVYDLVEDSQGNDYIAMEHVEGADLGLLLSDGAKISDMDCLDVGMSVCRALQHAHERGIVHRDIKPDNIMVAPGDQIKVMDFGIARLGGLGTEMRQTRVGGAIGTPHYMAPEQFADASGVDHRADLYSLGVVLYVMTCGSFPFDDENPFSLAERIRFEPAPRPSVWRPDMHGQLEALLVKSMAKRPDDRFQSALEFEKALRSASNAMAGFSDAAAPRRFGPTASAPFTPPGFAPAPASSSALRAAPSPPAPASSAFRAAPSPPSAADPSPSPLPAEAKSVSFERSDPSGGLEPTTAFKLDENGNRVDADDETVALPMKPGASGPLPGASPSSGSHKLRAADLFADPAAAEALPSGAPAGAASEDEPFMFPGGVGLASTKGFDLEGAPEAEGAPASPSAPFSAPASGAYLGLGSPRPASSGGFSGLASAPAASPPASGGAAMAPNWQAPPKPLPPAPGGGHKLLVLGVVLALGLGGFVLWQISQLEDPGDKIVALLEAGDVEAARALANGLEASDAAESALKESVLALAQARDELEKGDPLAASKRFSSVSDETLGTWAAVETRSKINIARDQGAEALGSRGIEAFGRDGPVKALDLFRQAAKLEPEPDALPPVGAGPGTPLGWAALVTGALVDAIELRGRDEPEEAFKVIEEALGGLREALGSTLPGNARPAKVREWLAGLEIDPAFADEYQQIRMTRFYLAGDAAEALASFRRVSESVAASRALGEKARKIERVAELAREAEVEASAEKARQALELVPDPRNAYRARLQALLEKLRRENRQRELEERLAEGNAKTGADDLEGALLAYFAAREIDRDSVKAADRHDEAANNLLVRADQLPAGQEAEKRRLYELVIANSFREDFAYTRAKRRLGQLGE